MFRPFHWGVAGVAGLLACTSPAVLSSSFNPALLSDYQSPNSGALRQDVNDNANELIDPFSGMLRLSYTDLVMPGRGGLDLSIQRVYNNKQQGEMIYQYGNLGRSVAGIGWDIHFGRIWLHENQPTLNSSTNNKRCQTKFASSTRNPVLELADGSRELLVNSDSSSFAYTSKGRWVAKCLPSSLNKNKVGGLVVNSPDGKEYIFNQWGQLPYGRGAYYVTKITDARGNYISFDYSVEKSNFRNIRLLSAKTNDGRKLTFKYNNSENLLDEIKTNDNRSVKFYYQKVRKTPNFIGASKYRNAYFLKEVKRPDLRKWKYTYSENNGAELYSLKTVTSPIGMKTTYRYDKRKMDIWDNRETNVITQKDVRIPHTSGSRRTWKYSYTQKQGKQDSTLVTGPYHCERYYHIGQKTVVRRNGTNRDLWKIGTLQKKITYPRKGGSVSSGSSCSSNPIQTETFTWTKQKIASQNEVRSADVVVDENTYVPLLSKHVINRGGKDYSTEYSNFDNYGNPQKVVEKGQKTRTITRSYYKPKNEWILGLVRTERISGGGNTSNSYYSNGLLKQSNQNGVITKYGYSSGNLEYVTDANNQTTRYENHYRGIPRTTRYPDGTTATRTVNNRGVVTSETNARGHTTHYEYDRLNRLTKVTPPKGDSSRTDIQYIYSGGAMEKKVIRSGHTFSTFYNALGNPFKQVQSASGKTITQLASYNTIGQQTYLSYPAYGSPNKGVTFKYDALGRLISKKFPDNAEEKYHHKSHNKLEITNPRNHKTLYTYRSFGHPDQQELMKINAPESMETTITRNILGHVTSVSLGGKTRSYHYNNKYFVEYEDNPETGRTSYTYDNVGNVLSKQVGSGEPFRYRYDNQYRLTKLFYPDNTSDTPDVNYDYDQLGNLTALSQANADWTYEYDSHNKLLIENATLKNKATNNQYSFGYVYNNQDIVEAISYPSGLTIDYQPNNLGKATQVGQFANHLEFFADGQLKSMTYGNGQSLSLGQHPQRQWLDSIQVGSAVNLSYSFDTMGNVKGITDSINSANSHQMTYDGVNRLASATGQWGNASYRYNSLGDITSKQLGNTNLTYHYDGQGRLGSVSGSDNYQFGYDRFGNATSTGKRHLTFNNAGNQVLSACYATNGSCQSQPDFSFQYDGHNRRILTQKADGSGYYSLYNQQGQLILEEDINTQAVTEYIYLGNQMVAKRQLSPATH